MTRDQIQLLIDAAYAQITAINAAIDALTTGGITQYTLNTGQTVQTVTKMDINRLVTTVDRLINRCVTLETRLNGSASIMGLPRH